ncbi:MAG TPA: GIY-YIG nuclease family protein [Stellaceae bacterium]|jgi:putative endonuclease|nr:GIY-YIG nuclease family protein [Stellaceae bacterium]
MSRGGWVYIMTNKPRGTLYIGVTSDIACRAFENREGAIEGFTKQHGLKRLVFVERHEEILSAIQRAKTMKHGREPGRSRQSSRKIPVGTIFMRSWPDIMDPRNKSAGDV